MMVEIEYEEELGDINPTELKPKIERLQVLDQQYSHYENLENVSWWGIWVNGAVFMLIMLYLWRRDSRYSKAV